MAHMFSELYPLEACKAQPSLRVFPNRKQAVLDRPRVDERTSIMGLQCSCGAYQNISASAVAYAGVWRSDIDGFIALARLIRIAVVSKRIIAAMQVVRDHYSVCVEEWNAC